MGRIDRLRGRRAAAGIADATIDLASQPRSILLVEECVSMATSIGRWVIGESATIRARGTRIPDVILFDSRSRPGRCSCAFTRTRARTLRTCSTPAPPSVECHPLRGRVRVHGRTAWQLVDTDCPPEKINFTPSKLLARPRPFTDSGAILPGEFESPSRSPIRLAIVETTIP